MDSHKEPNTECENCGQKFYAAPYRLKRGWGKYCSQECQNEAQRKGEYVECAYCGKEIYRKQRDLDRESKTGLYFCDKSCQCAWKNKRRKSEGKLEKITGETIDDLESFVSFLRKKFLDNGQGSKKPPKWKLYNLYWEQDYNQTKIAEMFDVTHTSVRRWLDSYKIKIKPRSLSCGQNPNSLDNLELGDTPEAHAKGAETRREYTKRKLIQKIRNFVQEHNHIPAKREFAKNDSLPHYSTYRDYFDNWGEAIREAGYKPNDPLFSSQQQAKDGHRCNSVSEVIIDNWLFKNNIDHQKEVTYPEGKYRCDFVVRDLFIEFFGLADAENLAPDYNSIMKTKREICKRHDIPLIELYEEDLKDLDKSLGAKLKHF